MVLLKSNKIHSIISLYYFSVKNIVLLIFVEYGGKKTNILLSVLFNQLISPESKKDKNCLCNFCIITKVIMVAFSVEN